MKKILKTLLGMVMTLSMILTTIPGITPLEVQAKALAYGNGNMYMTDSSSYSYRIVDMTGKYPPSAPKGVSYNKSTNTLTLKNANYPGYRLKVLSMGDLTIELKGTNRLFSIDASGSLGQTVSLTFSGNGKIIMNSKSQYGQRNCYIQVIGSNAKLTFGKNVSADIKASSGNTPITIGKDEANSPGNTASYLKISGSHSSGSLKWKGSYYCWYEWNKQQFTKKGGSSSASSSSKKTTPAKPAQVKNAKGTSANKKATFTWTKIAKNCTGYQVQLSYNKKFTSATKKTIKGNANVKTTFSKLKSGKYVYFRVRAYNTGNKKTKYGDWSKTVKIKVKSGKSASKKTGPLVTGIKATSPEEGEANFTWNTLSSCSGYEAQLSYNVNFKDPSTYPMPQNNFYNVYWSCIPSGQIVYFRIRAYNIKDGKKVYGSWSDTIKLKVK